MSLPDRMTTKRKQMPKPVKARRLRMLQREEKLNGNRHQKSE